MKKTPKKNGRPKIPVFVEDLKIDGLGKLKSKTIDLEQVLHWIDVGATAEEIAGSYRLSVDTLNRRLIDFTGLGFAELKEKLSGKTKIKLRESQFKLAETNATMSIWLGKIVLGQSENQQKSVGDLNTLVDYIKNTPKEEIEAAFAQQD